MMAQDVEQFANRVRNNDLYIKMFLEMEDSTGMPINYYHTAKLDLSFEQKDLLFVRDLIQTCNDMLERNEEESKYNPLITSLLTSNRYLKYDENDCRYYVDETTYKLFVFEERYSEYSKQLNVLINGMKYYGYTVTRTDHTQRISEENAASRPKNRSQDPFSNNPGSFRSETASFCVVVSRRSYSDSDAQLVPVV